MKTKVFWIVILTISTLLLAGCVRSASTAPVVDQAATIQAAVAGTLTAQVPRSEPTPTLLDPTATNEPTATSMPEEESDIFADLTECPYKDTGSSQPESEPIVFLDDLDLYVLELDKLPGCAVIFEGRLPWQTVYGPLSQALSSNGIMSSNGTPWPSWNVHFIIDVRSSLGSFDPRPYNELVADLIPDQYMDDLVYKEGSVWFYDPTWNMSDFAEAKASIAEELEVKKRRDAMDPGEYLFPRVIVQPNDEMFLYYGVDSGDNAYSAFPGCTAGVEPEEIPVHGLWNGSSFSAAIGAGQCSMAMWIDGSATPTIWYGYQKDGDEIVSYQAKVEAWIFPVSWTEMQVNDWVAAH